MKTDLIIDLMAAIGGLLVAVGVFLEFGLSWALIVFGFFLFAFALLAAKAQQSELNVPDIEETAEIAQV